MKTKTIIIAISLFVSTTVLTMAQQSVIDETSPPSLAVKADNLACLKSMQCIQKENLFGRINLDIFRNGNGRFDGYTIEGSSKNEELFAQYDHRGDLIRSNVIQRNIPLSREIRNQLINEEFSSWNMIGNECRIKNFDRKSIEYKLILQREDEIRVVYFDYKGQNKNRLA
ncbi:hypothetical protein DYD21_14205 [Rhodohalobacter sp. SW132]|uniref:hypothetical protein n=1 Tax=Rhodohalobacter sp. SW132 TaxID=2293433 RepID=UPI000E2581A5|nr:hypothetical protein [Rhodohalobacter sp. SW132]REL32964.1 hypothetical protein DYD21_14205 [Rhodohalobacter sp. SW132]